MKALTDMGVDKKIDISIIIRTYNEEKYFRNCLETIFKQKTKHTFEVIVVDSGSKDNTIKIAENFDVKILRIPENEFTYGKSLNMGCSLAEGKYLVFLSAHAIPYSTSWLNELIKPFDSKTAAVFGKQLPMKDASPLVERFDTDTWNNPKSIKYIGLSNTNAAIKKEVWKNIRFDEEVATSEDRLWAIQVKRSGLIVKYNSKAAVYHSHNSSLIQAYRKYYQHLCADVSMNKNPLIIFVYLRDIFYNFAADIFYIIRKKENLLWIPYSLISNSLKLLACIRCGIIYSFNHPPSP